MEDCDLLSDPGSVSPLLLGISCNLLSKAKLARHLSYRTDVMGGVMAPCRCHSIFPQKMVLARKRKDEKTTNHTDHHLHTISLLLAENWAGLLTTT